MLQNTFCHISGIGLKTEKSIWEKGIYSWTDFASRQSEKKLAPRQQMAGNIIAESFNHLADKNPNYFEARLPSHQHWRMFPEFRTHTAYLDIETTGLDTDSNEITTIALYDGHQVRYYVNGRNLEAFQDDILNYKVLVTFNGKCFDVPFLERYFNMQLDHAQIDLRYVLKSLGFKGGLKKCEARLGIDRGNLSGVDGYFAVLLWADYINNKNTRALETLLAYNIEDVVNLETLMVMAYNMNIKDTPFFPELEIALPLLPKIPFQPDLETIDRIKYHRGIRLFSL